MGRVREEKRRRKKIKKRKPQKKEDPGARKGRKVAKHCVFPMICGSGGSKSRLAKAAGAEPDEKLHFVVARSTFATEKAKNTSRSDHSWKLRCRKSARRCGAKHISKSKCTKHLSSRALLEVEMFKQCTTTTTTITTTTTTTSTSTSTSTSTTTATTTTTTTTTTTATITITATLYYTTIH